MLDSYFDIPGGPELKYEYPYLKKCEYSHPGFSVVKLFGLSGNWSTKFVSLLTWEKVNEAQATYKHRRDEERSSDVVFLFCF